MSILTPNTGNNPLYRFYISEASSTSYEVYPLNFLSTSLIDQQEEGKIFYRRKFNGTLLFGTTSRVTDYDDGITIHNRKEDFDLFWSFEQYEPCVKLYLTITKTVAGVVTTYWEGMFSTTDGIFDLDKCTFEVTPQVNDDYHDLLDAAEIQYNILDVTTIVSTTAKFGTIIDIDYTRNRWLARLAEENVLEYLADKVLPGVTVSSDFFTEANNPATLNPNHLLYLTIAQKSDIIRPASTDPATTAMMSWSELMDILWGMFQVTWDYDSTTDTINVEHISWWTHAAGLDLRTQMLTQSTNKYSYTKEKMPKYEKFRMMEADNEEFVGTSIWYDSACIDPNNETNSIETIVPNVTTDLEYIINTPDAISDEGFVILCNYEDGGNYFVDYQVGMYIEQSVRLNMHLSWANLHYYYFRNERVLISGYLNGVLTDFWTAKKTKQQKCKAIICDDYDPDDEITTELGETYLGGVKAHVGQSSLSPSGEIDFTLLYGPADNVNTGVTDLKAIGLRQDDTGVLYAELSEPADMDIHITIENSDCADVPNADVDFVILTGDRSANVDMAHTKITGGAPFVAPAGDWAVYEYTTEYTCA